MKEISDQIKEQEFRQAALEIIKARHRHDDGTEVVLKEAEESEMERKIIESENEWKLKTQQQEQSPQELFAAEQRKQTEKQQEETIPQPKKEKVVMTSCSCGELFSTKFKDDRNPFQGEAKVKAYNAKGWPEGGYASGSAGQESYSVSGNTSKDYGS